MKNKLRIKNRKKALFIVIIIALIIIITSIIINSKNKNKNNASLSNNTTSNEKFVTVSETGSKTNISSKIKEKKTVENLEFSNLKIIMKNNQTFVTGNVSNPTKDSIKGFYFKITALNESGDTIAETDGLLNSVISAGETTTFETITSKDFANCYDINITKIKDAD